MKILTIYFITFPMPSCFPKIPICNFSWLIIWLYSAAISFSVFHRQAKKKKKNQLRNYALPNNCCTLRLSVTLSPLKGVSV